MNIYDQIEGVIGSKKPKTTGEKHKLALELIDAYNKADEASNAWKWFRAAMLYKLDREGLYPYAWGKVKSQRGFFQEMGIPLSTARLLIQLFAFYVVKHKIPIKKLKECDTRKLGEAYWKIRDMGSVAVSVAVEYCVRGAHDDTDFKELIQELQNGVQ